MEQAYTQDVKHKISKHGWLITGESAKIKTLVFVCKNPILRIIIGFCIFYVFLLRKSYKI